MIGVSQAVRSPFVYEERADEYYSEEITVGGVPVGTLREQVTLGNPELENEKIVSHEDIYIAFSPGNNKSIRYASILDNAMLQFKTSGVLKDLLFKYGIKEW